MSNALGAYNPIFYSQELLIALKYALGMAGRVYRRLEAEKGRQPGDTITLRKPAVFSALNAPTTAQDLISTSVNVSLNQWKEVKFGLRDDEITFSGDRIITEHIQPAAYAIANAIDASLQALWKDIPWIVGAPITIAELLVARQRMFDNGVPMDDLHFEIDGTSEAALLALAAFSQYNGAGEQGVSTQMRGTLGNRFGMEFFASQNVARVTSATVADLAGAVDNGAGYAAGATGMVLKSLAAAAVFQIGDALTITGQTQRYVLTAIPTIDGAGGGTVAFFPGLAAAVVDSQVVTVTLSGGTGATKSQNLLFNRNAFALVMAPLSEAGDNRGAEISTISDPDTGLSVRSRIFYEGNNSKLFVSMDALWGVKTLDPNMAVRALGA